MAAVYAAFAGFHAVLQVKSNVGGCVGWGGLSQ